MRYQPYPPSKPLAAYVKRFVVSEAAAEQSYTVLPDTSLVMGFQYRGQLVHLDKTTEIPLDTSGITGIQNGFRTFRNSPAVGSVLVVFTETGAASFFREPIHELFDQSLGLDQFVRCSALDAFEEQLSQAASDRERIQLVEQFLRARFRETQSDGLVVQALQRIHQTNGTIGMRSLLDQLCSSQSPLEKRFRRLVGTTPKKFASIVRMQHAIRLLADNESLTQTGLEAGYFDQAHFSHEFKRFTGVSPIQFLRTASAV